MSTVKPTAEGIVLSRWNSQGRLPKIISVGLICVYIFGVIYGSVMPISSEISWLFLLWPGIIAYIAVSYWLAVVICSNIFVSFRKRPQRKKAIYVLLPSVIIAFYSTFVFAMEELLSEAKEEVIEK